jgi:hypothetical protein
MFGFDKTQFWSHESQLTLSAVVSHLPPEAAIEGEIQSVVDAFVKAGIARRETDGSIQMRLATSFRELLLGV